MIQANKEVLPIRFDPLPMAKHRRELTGLVAVKAMTRLQDTIVSMEPMVAVSLQFSRGLQGFPAVSGRLKHTLGLRCERCLDEVSIFIDQPLEVLLKPESEPLPEDTERYSLFEYDGKILELAELIEDELLLALPLVPKHKDISLCNQDMVAWLASNEVPAENAGNPFAILKR